MEQFSTSMVLHPSVVNAREEQRLWQEKSRQEALSPFAAFMGELERRHASRKSTQQGSIQWMSLPYEKMVVQGLWLLIESAATKYDFDHDTEQDLMDNLLPRLNAVINNALALRYNSAEAAVAAFEEKMLRDTEVANELVFASERWNQASAEFFAELVKAAENHGNHLIDLSKKTERLNRVIDGGEYIGASVFEQVVFKRIRTPYLFLRREDVSQSYQLYSFGERIQDETDELEERIELIQQLRKLPLNLKELSAQGLEFKDVNPTWLITQGVLAAGDAPLEDECLNGSNYNACRKAVKELDAKQLTKLFWSRMQRRSKHLGLIPELLEAAVEEALKSVYGDGFDLAIHDAAYVDTYSLELDNLDVETIGEIIESTGSTGSTAHDDAYFRTVDWSTYDAEKIVSQIAQDGDADIFFRYHTIWSEEVQLEVSNRLISRHDELLSPDEVALISKLRIHHPFSQDQLEGGIITFLDPAYLVEHFTVCLDAADHQVGNYAAVRHVLEQFSLHASDEHLQRVASESQAISLCIMLSAYQEAYHVGLPRILQRIPTELREWQFVLAEAALANSNYEAAKTDRIKNLMPAWPNRFSFPQLAKPLKLTKKRMKELLSRISEEEAFVQSLGGDSRVKDLLEIFRTNRAINLAL